MTKRGGQVINLSLQRVFRLATQRWPSEDLYFRKLPHPIRLLLCNSIEAKYLCKRDDRLHFGPG
jgi:hypothetical protein